MTAPLVPELPGYEDPQLIAHGTTALVFRAIQTRLNRPVAIKVITADSGDGSVPVNVERELATTVALSSQPHIVSIIDTGVTDDGRRYIVMEYCEGGSYAQILRQRGPLPTGEVVEVGIKIGQALHAAHQAGILHRDVKPSNILRSRFGPALTDFGIARAPDELGGTLTREMMTPHHASPEALLHQAQSGLSDVYSLASTMWTLLVGHPPFVDPDRPDMDMYTFRDRVLHESLPPMSRNDVPEWLVGELRRAMAKVPEQRHASALDFSDALQRGSLGLPAADAPGSDAPAPSVSRVGRPRLRNWPPSARSGEAPAPATPEPETTSDPPAAPAPPGFEAAPIYRPAPPADGPWVAPPPAPPGPPVLVAPRPASTEAGWLAPTIAGSDLVPVQPRARREWVVQPTRRSRGRVLLFTAVAILLTISAASTVLAFVFSRSDAPSTPPGPTVVAPVDLSIEEDDGTSVTLTWTDQTGGQLSYVVQRLGPDELSRRVSAGGAHRSITFTNLDATADYCFRVGAFIDEDDIRYTDEVCTSRNSTPTPLT